MNWGVVMLGIKAFSAPLNKSKFIFIHWLEYNIKKEKNW
jgi:hypothetical protein